MPTVPPEEEKMGQTSVKIVVTNPGSLSSCWDLPAKLQTLLSSLSHRTKVSLDRISEGWSSPFCAKGVLSLTIPPEKDEHSRGQLCRHGAASCRPGISAYVLCTLVCCAMWSLYTLRSPAMACHSLLCRSDGCGISRGIFLLLGSQGVKQADTTVLAKGQSLQNQRTQMAKIISVTEKCWSIDFVLWEELAS